MMRNVLMLVILVLSFYSVNSQTLSLENCRNAALENNKNLKVREKQIEVAREMKKVAFVQHLPSLSGVGSYIYNSEYFSLLSEDKYAPVGSIMPDGSFGFTQDQVNNNWTLVNGNPVPLDLNNQPFDPKQNPEKIQWKGYALLPKDAFTVKNHNMFVASLTLMQPIYMGGKIRELNKLAGYAENAAKARQDGSLSDILYSVDEAYWQVVSVSNKLKLAQKYQDLMIQLNKDVTEVFNQGLATQSDILKIKVKQNESELNVIKAQNGLNLSKMLLCQLIGLTVDSEITLVDEDLNTELVTSQSHNVSIESVYENRSEIKLLEQALKVSESNIKLKKSEFLPNIGLTASYNWLNPNPYNGFEKELAGAWNVGLAVKISIFHWGERFHKLHASRAEHEINQLQIEEAKEKIALQVRQTEYKTAEAVKRLDMTSNNLESAKENLTLAQEGFKEGVITLSDLMSAQTAWQSANNERIDAVIDVMLCNTYLLKVTGNLK